MANSFFSEGSLSGKSGNHRINIGDLWWAWVYQGNPVRFHNDLQDLQEPLGLQRGISWPRSKASSQPQSSESARLAAPLRKRSSRQCRRSMNGRWCSRFQTRPNMPSARPSRRTHGRKERRSMRRECSSLRFTLVARQATATFLVPQSLRSDGVRARMPVRLPFGMSAQLRRNHLQESTCFARIITRSKPSMSCLRFYCFQQTGESAFRSKLTPSASSNS